MEDNHVSEINISFRDIRSIAESFIGAYKRSMVCVIDRLIKCPMGWPVGQPTEHSNFKFIRAMRYINIINVYMIVCDFKVPCGGRGSIAMTQNVDSTSCIITVNRRPVILHKNNCMSRRKLSGTRANADIILYATTFTNYCEIRISRANMSLKDRLYFERK